MIMRRLTCLFTYQVMDNLLVMALLCTIIILWGLPKNYLHLFIYWVMDNLLVTALLCTVIIPWGLSRNQRLSYKLTCLLTRLVMTYLLWYCWYTMVIPWDLPKNLSHLLQLLLYYYFKTMNSHQLYVDVFSMFCLRNLKVEFILKLLDA